MSKDTIPESFVKVAEQKVEEGFVYVTIPEKDILGNTHPDIALNYNSWGPGTHKVNKAQAAYIEDRLRVFNEETIRLMQPKQHAKSMREVRPIAGASPIKMNP